MKLLLPERNLIQIVNQPTQRMGHILDWVVIRNDDKSISNLQVTDKCISDHFVITLNFNMSKPKPTKNVIQSRNIKAIDMNVFKSNLSQSLSETTDSQSLESLSSNSQNVFQTS